MVTVNGELTTVGAPLISGSAGNLIAFESDGSIFHSTGGAFDYVFTFKDQGANALFSLGQTVVAVQNRRVRTCLSNCTTDAAFATFNLVSQSLFGNAACGKDASTFAIVLSDNSSTGVLYEWQGIATGYTQSTVLPIRYPQACWYDAQGGINVVGVDGVARVSAGQAKLQPISTKLINFVSGFELNGVAWVTGDKGGLAKRTSPTGTWSLVDTHTTTAYLGAIGGLKDDEVYAFGLFDTSAGGNGNGFRWNGQTLVPAGDVLPQGGVTSKFLNMLSTGTELYVGGTNSQRTLIIRGHY